MKLLLVTVTAVALVLIAYTVVSIRDGVDRVRCVDELAFSPAPPGLTLIAHAGGGLREGNYSNSREAFAQSIRNGFGWIEVDFVWTSDDRLVLLHDWKGAYSYWYDLGPIRRLTSLWGSVPTESVLEATAMSHGLHRLTLDDLLAGLRENPAVSVVTDIKEDNVRALSLISEHSGASRRQIIPQIYSRQQYDSVVALGFTDPILTLYQSDLSIESVRDFALERDLSAISMPASRAARGDARELRATGIPVFAHAINTPDEASLIQELGASGVYTDCLIPPT